MLRNSYSFKRQPHKMFKNAQTIRRQFVGLALKGLNEKYDFAHFQQTWKVLGFFRLWQKSCSRGEVRGVLKILVKLGILRISGPICPQCCCYLLKWSSTYVLEISCFEQFQKILDKIPLKDCFSFCFEKETFFSSVFDTT